MPMVVVVAILIAIVMILIITNIRIIPQSEAAVIERLGAYCATWNVGIHVKLPFIDRVASRVSLKERVLDFQPQPVITKDNVTMMIDTVVYFQITDPKLYTYGVENPLNAIENLSATTLRNLIGDLELDQTLTSRDVINTKMRSILDEATDPWGIKVNRVEVKNIIPPEAIKEAMEKQMRAERERREQILIAEGKKQSAILVAEGERQSKILEGEAQKQAMILAAEAQKQSTILQGEAEKQAMILQAEAEKQSMILKGEAAKEVALRQAEAEKQSMILKGEAAKEVTLRQAEGEAVAIREVQGATAEGLRMLKEVAADEALLRLRGLEAFEKAADGQATKIIIPSELQRLAGLATTLSEMAKS